MKKQLDIKLGERNQINALYEDHKQHYEAMRQRLALAERRLAEEVQGRRDLEFSTEQRVADLKRGVEQKQRELEALQAKMALPVDTDIMRMKIAKDMEARHRVELEHLQQELDRLAEQYYEAKRLAEVLRAQNESLKSEGERELRDLKEKHRQELQELTLENQALQSRAEDRRDRDLIRQLRREVDEHKRRATELLSENSDLRKERDQLKLDCGELSLRHTRDSEELRNALRLAQTECERAAFRCQVAEDERQKLLLKVEKRQAEVSGGLAERAQLQAVLREKDALVEGLQRQVGQLKGEAGQAEAQRAELLRKMQDELRDAAVRERKEKSKLQKEVETLTRQLVDIEAVHKADLLSAQSEVERVLHDSRVLAEEKRVAHLKLRELQAEADALQQ